MDKDKSSKDITKAEKNKRKPPFFSLEAQQVGLNPGDNTRFLRMSMTLASLPAIDLQDGEAVENRVVEYFRLHAEQDMKPTVMGLGIALGLDRRRLWEIKTGAGRGGGKVQELPRRTVDVIKKAYFLMENQWEQYMLNGKLNPVSGIFLGKNNFGYQDKTEYVLTPNQSQDSDYDAEAIKERYISPQPKQLPEEKDSD